MDESLKNNILIRITAELARPLVNELFIIEKEIDALFDINFKKRESELVHLELEKEAYSGQELENMALNTTYGDFYQVLKYLQQNKISSFVDLGAGYGRSALLSSLFFPEIETTCIEYIRQRIEEGRKAAQRSNLPLGPYVHANLLNPAYPLPQSQCYFIYLPTGKLLQRVLSALKDIAAKTPVHIIAIESHGDLINRISIEDWLLTVDNNLETIAPRHDKKIYHFKSKAPEVVHELQTATNLLLSLFKISQTKNEPFYLCYLSKSDNINLLEQLIFRKKSDLMISLQSQDLNSDDLYSWCADLHMAMPLTINRSLPAIELTFPPKQAYIPSENLSSKLDVITAVKAIELPISGINTSIRPGESSLMESLPQLFLARRRDVDFTIVEGNGLERSAGKLRKIITSPTPILEFSKVGRVNYDNLSFIAFN